MQKSNYEVEILVNGHPIKEYCKVDKVYVEGRKGCEYSIRIKNNGYKRILAIPTIDGLSVLNGKEANYNSPGYIINGYDSLTIDGWRTSDSEIAKFYFSNPEDSYSKRTNKSNNLGIIGVAIFREKERVYNIPLFKPFSEQLPDIRWFKEGPSDYPFGEQFNLSSQMVKGSAVNCSAKHVNDSFAQEVGTGFGETKESHVIKVDFEKEQSPDAVFNFYYNTRKQLEKLGIDFNRKPQYMTPQAFPNEYCEKPRY